VRFLRVIFDPKCLVGKGRAALAFANFLCDRSPLGAVFRRNCSLSSRDWRRDSYGSA
jgi:hypothetical protein